MTPASYDLRRKIGIVPQNVAVSDELSVRENIDFFCGLYVKDKEKRRKLVDEAIEFAGLAPFTKFRPKKQYGKRAGGYSFFFSCLMRISRSFESTVRSPHPTSSPKSFSCPSLTVLRLPW